MTDELLRGIGAATPGLDVERALADRGRPDMLKALTRAERTAAEL